MRKTAVVIAVAIIALFSFNERELYKKDIRNRLVIQGIGIDAEKDGSYTVTLQAVNTSSQSSSMSDSGPEEPVQLYKVTGDTVYTAMKSVTEYEGKMPLYSQNRVIIIGRETAEKGLEGVIDFFVRDVENSASVRVAVADGRASEILEGETEAGQVSARNIEQSIRSAEYEPEISELQLYELVGRYRDKCPSFLMPVVALKDKKVDIKESALFKGARLMGTVKREETIMLNFLSDTSYNGAVSFETEKGEKIAVSIIDSKTRRRVSLENGAPVFNIKVKAECDIAEIYNGIEKGVDRKRLSELKNDAEKHIKNEIEKVIEKTYRNMQCDSVGLSRLLYIFEPSFYRENEKNLNTVMAESRYNVEVEVTVRRTGHEFIDIM